MTLISKIAAASLAMGSFATDKRNSQGNYDYISADQVLSRAGRALAEQGVVVAPSVTAEVTEEVKYGQGKTRHDSVVEMDMHISDGETEMVQHWVGRGSDYTVPDKAMYKAITSGHKYFLMKLLNIGVGNEDGEHENGQTATNGTTATAQTKAAQPIAAQLNGSGEAPEPVEDDPFADVPENVRKAFHATGTKMYGPEWNAKRGELCAALGHKSSKQLTEAEMKRLTAGMAAKMAQESA